MMEWILILVLLAAPQGVLLDFEDGPEVDAFFRASLIIHEDGQARGGFVLHHPDPDELRRIVRTTVVFDEGEFMETADGLLLVTFTGSGSVRQRPGRLPTRDEFTGRIGPWDPTSEDDPIWHFHSGNVYEDGVSFEAFTELIVIPEEEPRVRRR